MRSSERQTGKKKVETEVDRQQRAAATAARRWTLVAAMSRAANANPNRRGKGLEAGQQVAAPAAAVVRAGWMFRVRPGGRGRMVGAVLDDDGGVWRNGYEVNGVAEKGWDVTVDVTADVDEDVWVEGGRLEGGGQRGS